MILRICANGLGIGRWVAYLYVYLGDMICCEKGILKYNTDVTIG